MITTTKNALIRPRGLAPWCRALPATRRRVAVVRSYKASMMLQRVAEHLSTPRPVVAAAPSEPRIVKWGVMGTANIADIVLPALVAAPNCEVLACASRSVEKAAEWAAERSIPRAYGSYQELLEDPDVDALYIPLPTTLHIEWVGKAAAAKKHILIEKPVALTAEDAQTMVDACNAAGVLLMDAV
jgi:hypothetical protein